MGKSNFHKTLPYLVVQLAVFETAEKKARNNIVVTVGLGDLLGWTLQYGDMTYFLGSGDKAENMCLGQKTPTQLNLLALILKPT